MTILILDKNKLKFLNKLLYNLFFYYKYQVCILKSIESRNNTNHKLKRTNVVMHFNLTLRFRVALHLILIILEIVLTFFFNPLSYFSSESYIYNLLY